MIDSRMNFRRGSEIDCLPFQAVLKLLSTLEIDRRVNVCSLRASDRGTRRSEARSEHMKSDMS
jgi:hypothetical protein